MPLVELYFFMDVSHSYQFWNKDPNAGPVYGHKDFHAKIAPALKSLRIQRGVTQKELAATMGSLMDPPTVIEQSYVSNVERRAVDISMSRFALWCEALGIRMYDVLTRATVLMHHPELDPKNIAGILKAE